MKKNELKKDKNIKLELFQSIKAHNLHIYFLIKFPSGNLISCSRDWSIKIWDENLNLIQNIEKAHDNGVAFIYIKDEKNFISCSSDKSIRTWIKKNNNFEINQIINESHSDSINQVIYTSNHNLISCSWDYTIKIWELNNNNIYQVKTCLKHNERVCSILLLEKLNIFISSGIDGSKFWNYNNLELLFSIENTLCGCWNCLKNLDNDRIIIRGEKKKKTINVISIQKKKVIKEIEIGFYCNGFCVIKEKNVFLVCGNCNDILILRTDNYEKIFTLKNAHNSDIYGFEILNKDYIASYSKDGKIKIWSY